MSATVVLTNGRIYTQDPRKPQVTAVAIRNNQILATGSDDEMKALLGSGGEWIDLNGRCVTPGLVDAHVHFQWFSLGLQQVSLDGTKSLDEALQRIQTKLATENRPLNSENWLRGRGWRIDDWPTKAFPTAADLDKVVPDIPAHLPDKSGHAVWVNSKALKIAGITAATPDPPGGQIQRDEQGNPTGILFEDAIGLVAQHIPRPTPAQIATAMQTAQEQCWQVGLTGIHDFDGRDCFLALQMLKEQGQLGLRFVKNIPVYRLEHAIGAGLRSGFGDDWLRIGGTKIFADGALGPRTASMIAPYEGQPDNYGIIVTDKEEMMEKASQSSAAGLSVTIHAIGDRANHDVLDVYEAVRAEEQGRVEAGEQRSGGAGGNSLHPTSPAPHPLRHRIEHVQLLHPDDLNRLGELNVIASMQPTHVASDMEMVQSHWGDRAPYSYAWRTMLDSGALLVFGSDAPIEKIDPLPGIYTAVSRRRADGAPNKEGWYPQQKLNMSEAIHAFTMAAALTSGQEARQGTITPGKLADLTIFDRDIFTIPAEELLETKIAGTIVDGHFKYRTF